MAIYPPGKRDRHGKSRAHGQRNVVGVLSLTAMVDMFTVLTIFLLQNFNSTGHVIYIPKEVTLPKATEVKELAPAHVVTISSKELLIDKDVVTDYNSVKDSNDWIIDPLLARLSKIIKDDEAKAKAGLQANLKKAVKGQPQTADPLRDRPWLRVTVQADKDIEIGILKKVMATVTESGAAEINFAVTKKPATPESAAN